MLFLIIGMLFQQTINGQVPGPKGNRVLLPNGWWLSPAGEQIDIGDLPLNAALTQDERFLAITHSGASEPELMLIDLKERRVVQSTRLTDGWLGIKFDANKLFVSGGNQNCVYIFDLSDGKLVQQDIIRFAEPQPKALLSTAGLDVHNGTLAVVSRNDSTLRFFSRQNKKKESSLRECRTLVLSQTTARYLCHCGAQRK